ncbi:hypothetical protein ACMFL9_32010 (plasmid) [Sinorhizobium meliloti]
MSNLDEARGNWDALAWAIGAAVWCNASARACSLDGGLSADAFALSHPQSLSVALAINAAASAGEIKRPVVMRSPLSFFTVASYLEKFRTRLAKQSSVTSEFYLLVVEYGLWVRFQPTGEDLKMGRACGKPALSASVVLTGDAVVRALVDRKITAEEALAKGLLVSGRSSSIALKEIVGNAGD